MHCICKWIRNMTFRFYVIAKLQNSKKSFNNTIIEIISSVTDYVTTWRTKDQILSFQIKAAQRPRNKNFNHCRRNSRGISCSEQFLEICIFMLNITLWEERRRTYVEGANASCSTPLDIFCVAGHHSIACVLSIQEIPFIWRSKNLTLTFLSINLCQFIWFYRYWFINRYLLMFCMNWVNESDTSFHYWLFWWLWYFLEEDALNSDANEEKASECEQNIIFVPSHNVGTCWWNDHKFQNKILLKKWA